MKVEKGDKGLLAFAPVAGVAALAVLAVPLLPVLFAANPDQVSARSRSMRAARSIASRPSCRGNVSHTSLFCHLCRPKLALVTTSA